MTKITWLMLLVFLFLSPLAPIGGTASASRVAVEKSANSSIKKAAGANAVTVEEAFRESAKLESRQVVIRGKVAKVAAGIMGKNWVHIQDGTGSPAKGDHDLTCTTSEELPRTGEVVTVTGTLARNRDFGSGYFYSVIVEKASFKK